MTSTPLFRLEEVCFAVEGRALLQSVTLDLPRRRVLGLIGHNGSGKTTLLRLLTRGLRPTAGRISFDGRPLESWKDRAFARRVAYLPQVTPPADGLLVRELVAFGRYPWHGALGRFGEEDRALVAEAMRLTDLGELAERPVDSLSGGERQRAWLAMLLAQNADCLLLDEPTSALDIAHQVEVLSLIRRIGHTRDLAVILVLHDVNMAARYCDALVALRQGRLLVQGTPEEVMQSERLQAIYGLPLQVMRHPTTGQPMSYVP